ncbi:D-alanyl-D-alanine carboxypeptidase [Phenylobacterium sp.]|uniref:D-alanyl-D-alanine carboxypeptidase n=1 Tax=Phenylobacterium sp. TaxID=1871053 RepID=UPI003BAB22E6
MPYRLPHVLAGVTTLFLAVLLFLLGGLSRAEASAPGVDPGKFAAIVIDAATGEVLYEYQPDARRFPASLTKVMTLYMALDALEHGDLKRDSAVVISRHAAAQPPSKLGLPVGARLTVAEAMDVMVVKSANDVATALGETIAGSEREFGRRMTERAEALGMTHTHFVNASGLPDARHVSSARDLAILARAFLRDHPQDYRLFDQEQTVFQGRTIQGHNALLRRPGIDGFKTGYTNAAGYNLLTSGVRNGRRVIAVVLGGRTALGRDQLMRTLLSAGFATLAVRYAGLDITMRELLGRNDPAGPTPSQPAELATASLSRAMPRAQGDPAAGPLSAKDRWWVQVGAFSSRKLGHAQLAKVSQRHPRRLGSAAQRLEPAGRLFLARFGGLSEDRAKDTCQLLRREGADCLAGQSLGD